MTAQLPDEALEELLGVYALDACEPEEAAAVEELLHRRPELAAEAARLADAAAWIGAAGALEPPPGLRGAVFERLRQARPADDPAARLYAAETERVARELDRLDPDDDDVRTPNGLTARELVVHVAAQETLLARAVGRPVDDVDELDIDARTARFVERFAARPYQDVVDAWRQSVDAVLVWAAEPASHNANVAWPGLPLARDAALIARSFENWVHRDDLRSVRGAPSAPPPGAELHLMAELSTSILPPALALAGRARPGHTARVVLTGDGGGSWLIPLEFGEATPTAPPDVTLTTDVVDWCRVAAERLDSAELACTVDGDERLADELLEAASAFATL